MTKRLKITILGAGNAGCFTALHFGYYSSSIDKRDLDITVELIHDPTRPPEKVGQGTTLPVAKLLWESLGVDWYDNPIDATTKLGILYEGWGKNNDKIFHPFPLHSTALHFSPNKLQDTVLKSGYFNVIEREVIDYNDIDSDYIFDCRGKPDNLTGYKELENPVNSVILAQKPERDMSQNWTRSVATPDGWCFVIPNTTQTTSYGYLYDNKITPDDQAKINFENQFGVASGDQFKFKQYIADKPIIEDRIILNGNALFFLEPLEATAIGVYSAWVRMAWDWIINGSKTSTGITTEIHEHVTQVNNFITWHYMFGSKYDTPFWKAAEKLSFKDSVFDDYLMKALESPINTIAEHYGQWQPHSFTGWYDGMNKLPK
jgi:hypothetical protein